MKFSQFKQITEIEHSIIILENNSKVDRTL